MVGLAACGDDDDTATPTTTIDDATTSTTADSAGSTTTSEVDQTTTTEASDEDQITAAVMEYRTYHERLGNPADPSAAVIDEILTGAIQSRTIDTQNTNFVEGNYYEGGYEIEVYSVEIDGETALVMACAHDQITKRGPDGAELVPPAPAPVEYDFQLERDDGTWKVSDVNSYQEDSCTLGD